MIETPPDGAVPGGRVGVASPGDPAIDPADGERINAPTIYDVARLAGVSIATGSARPGSTRSGSGGRRATCPWPSRLTRRPSRPH